MVESTTHAGLRELLDVFSEYSNLAVLSHLVKHESETGTSVSTPAFLLSSCMSSSLLRTAVGFIHILMNTVAGVNL